MTGRCESVFALVLLQNSRRYCFNKLYAEGIYCDEITLSCKLWYPPPKGRKMAAKTAFRELFIFVSKTTHRFTHFRAADRFPWGLNTKRESVSSWILSEQNFEFFRTWSFTLIERSSLVLPNLVWSKLGYYQRGYLLIGEPLPLFYIRLFWNAGADDWFNIVNRMITTLITTFIFTHFYFWNIEILWFH